MIFRCKKMKYTNTNHKTKMPKLKTMERMMIQITNSSGMKKWEISATSIVALWIWVTLAMEMESFQKNSISDLTGSSKLDFHTSEIAFAIYV